MGILDDLVEVRQALEQKQLKSNQELMVAINELSERYHATTVENYESGDLEAFKKGFIAMIMGVSSLVDILFMDGKPENIQEAFFISTIPSYFLKKSHIFLRTEEGLKFVESLVLVLCKLFGQMTNIGIEAAEDSAVHLDLLIQTLTGIETYKRKSFRQTYLIPEFVRYSQMVVNRMTELMEAGELRPKAKLLKLIASMMSSFASLYEHDENFRVLIGKSLEALIKVIKKASAQAKASEAARAVPAGANKKPTSTDVPPEYIEAAAKVIELLNTPVKALDCKNIPLVKVKDFAPKIFDKEDEQSEYNVKFRLKLQKEKLRRVKSQTFRNLASDARAVQDAVSDKNAHIDKTKRKKLGELYRHIQEQQEAIKKEKTMNYKAPTRVKQKKTRMAGNAMAKSSGDS